MLNHLILIRNYGKIRFVMDIHNRINELLKQKNLKKTNLAEQTGLSYHTLTALFNRESGNMNVATLQRIAACLNTTLDYLITGDERLKERSALSQNTNNDDTSLNKFKQLNTEGRKVISDYLEDLIATGKYDDEVESNNTTHYFLKQFYSLNFEGRKRVLRQLQILINAGKFSGEFGRDHSLGYRSIGKR